MGGGTSDDTGRIPPGGRGDATLEDVQVPDTIKSNWNINFNATDSKVTDLNVPCSLPVPVHREFRVVPAAKTDLTPTQEAPEQLVFESSAQVTEGLKTDESISLRYKNCMYFLTSGPERQDDLCDGANLSGGNTWASTTFSRTAKKTLEGTRNPLPTVPVQAGHMYCSVMELEYTNGYVGSDGTILDGWSDAMANPAQDCRDVNNKPYFKIYGSGAKAGGEFPALSGSCDVGGTLASWNDTKDRKITGAKARGASSELSSVAREQIYGFATAQTRTIGMGMRSPSELTFANNPASIIDTNDSQSPRLGGAMGGMGGGSCLSNIEPPDNVDVVEGSTSTGTSDGLASATGAKSKQFTMAEGGYLDVGTRSLGANTHQSIFVDGDVYISGNIIYETAGWSKDSIPSFVLKATGNIYIAANVAQLDGLYIAQGKKTLPTSPVTKGKIFTCSATYEGTAFPWTDNMSDPNLGYRMHNFCKNQLVVRGAFVAEQVNLMRTGGSLRSAEGGEHPRPSTVTTPPTQGVTPSGACSLRASKADGDWPSPFQGIPYVICDNGTASDKICPTAEFLNKSCQPTLNGEPCKYSGTATSFSILTGVPYDACAFAAPPGPPPTPISSDLVAPTLSCTNANMGARVDGHEYTCAAEVFDFSPEMYLSSPLIKKRGGNAPQWPKLISLPPVL